MKYKITESQRSLINEMRNRRAINENEFIEQSYAPAGLTETDGGQDWYTINVTILSGFDRGVNANELDDTTYFKMAVADAKQKIEAAFQTGEFTIHTVSNKTRGEVNPLYLN